MHEIDGPPIDADQAGELPQVKNTGLIRVLDDLIALSTSQKKKETLRGVRKILFEQTTFSIEIVASKAGQEGSLTVYDVWLKHREISWHEACGSREQLEAFLQGLRAGCAMLNLHVPKLVIPRT